MADAQHIDIEQKNTSVAGSANDQAEEETAISVANAALASGDQASLASAQAALSQVALNSTPAAAVLGNVQAAINSQSVAQAPVTINNPLVVTAVAAGIITQDQGTKLYELERAVKAAAEPVVVDAPNPVGFVGRVEAPAASKAEQIANEEKPTMARGTGNAA